MPSESFVVSSTPPVPRPWVAFNFSSMRGCLRLLEDQTGGEWCLDARAEACEEAVETEKCAIEIDRVS